MRCPNCGQENRVGARFCGRCGQPLSTKPPLELTEAASRCPVCNSILKPDARFCPQCGTAISAPRDGVPAPTPPAHTVRAGERALPTVTPAPAIVSPQAAPEASRVEEQSRARVRRRPAWLVGVVMALLSGAVFFCLVMGLALLPAFGRSVPPSPEVDPSQADLTILVREAYISDMLAQALPEGVQGDAVVDVQPGNKLVTTIGFDLLFIDLEVIVHAGIGVEGGEIQVWVDRVETGGHDILELLNVNQVDLGQNITGAIQQGLEDELGPGSRLLTIVTDDTNVILTARWE
ncbi:MAG: zinc-ribbon domain-containing protein [Anaerolineae bacterium]